MAIVCLIKDQRVTSVLVGVNDVQQLDDNLKALRNINFNEEELKGIELILNRD